MTDLGLMSSPVGGSVAEEEGIILQLDVSIFLPFEFLFVPLHS